jgi:transmembrane 9 superfamily protein 3
MCCAVLCHFGTCYAVPVPKTTICSQTLSSDDAEAFKYAISRHYWYELFMDDLPIWGFVGDVKPSKAAGGEDTVELYAHKSLDISYNGDRVSCRAEMPICQQGTWQWLGWLL